MGKGNDEYILKLKVDSAAAIQDLNQFKRTMAITNAEISKEMTKVRTGNSNLSGTAKKDFLNESKMAIAANRLESAEVTDSVKKQIEGNNKLIASSQKKVTARKKTVGDLRKLTKAEFGSEYSGQVDSMYKTIDKSVPAMERYKMAVRKTKKEIASAGKTVKKEQVPFAGYAMSLMFFGMALQRMFSTIWKSSTKTFQDVMHSVEGTVTQFDMMEGSLKYLGFVVGSALEPIMSFLIPLVDKIADWAAENPKLTGSLVALLGVLGTLFMVGGTMKLALDGFTGLGLAIGGVTKDADGLYNYDWSKIGNKIGGALAITAGITFFIEGMKDWSDGKWLDGLLGITSGALTTIGGIKMIKGAGGGWMIAIGFAMKLVEMNKFFQTLFATIGLLSALFATMGEKAAYMFTEEFGNTLKRMLKATLNRILPGLGELVGNIDTGSDFDFGQSFKENYAAGLNIGKDWDMAIADWKAEVDAINEPSSSTPPSQTDLDDAMDWFKNNSATNVEVKVELDGQAIAANVSTRLLSDISVTAG